MNFIYKSISRKIIFWMFILMTISSLSVLFSTVTKVNSNNIETTKHNLDMLNTAIFQNLKNVMNTGDPAQIQKAEKEAASIKGIKHLIIAKSIPLIEMYDPEAKFTTDKDILSSFKSKKTQTIEIDNDKGHSLRMIKPMIATDECLMCHANQAKGDIIGIMDLSFSLENSDNSIKSIILNIVVTSTILGWLTIGIIFYVVNRATKPINGLKDGFKSLLGSNELDDEFKLNIDTKDEIGEVAHLFNDYMDKIRADLKQDAIVINETNDVLQKIASGFFVYEVTSTASNQHVEAMKSNLNFMIKKVKGTLDKINLTLRNYSQSNYDYKINDKDIYGDLGSVTASIKLVGNNTSEILAMILNTGDQLNENTHLLSKQSHTLSNSVTSQAETGKNTNKSLDTITHIIQHNTQNTIKMSQLAKNVTSSVVNGKILATSTSSAMDDIAIQVSSINDAITVIDQIAFQTNILSLNAAVEAATAGESGKGFAVVAQEVRNLASRSADAAKDIKNIVEKATQKANDGKVISDNMINDYHQLSDNINNTIELIEEVSNSSKEQEQSILKINMDIVQLERSIKDNAHVSKNISKMSNDIEHMSDRLVNAASKASFLQETRKQVCDIDLIYDIANLKVELFNYKDDVYARLANHSNNVVQEFTQLNSWLTEYSNAHNNVDKSLIETLTNMNKNLHIYLVNLTSASANNLSNTEINNFAKQVEIESMRIFGTLNKIKNDKCKEKNND